MTLDEANKEIDKRIQAMVEKSFEETNKKIAELEKQFQEKPKMDYNPDEIKKAAGEFTGRNEAYEKGLKHGVTLERRYPKGLKI